MVSAMNTSKVRYAVISMVLGFLVGGSVLNISALGCILYVMTAYWGIVVKKKVKMSVCISVPMLAGGIMNAIAPGNFVRKGGSVSYSEIWDAVVSTFSYLVYRVKWFLLHYPLFTAVLLVLVLLLAEHRIMETTYQFYVPVLFSGLMIAAVGIVIYPVMLGYGEDVYFWMERSNFISDFVIFLAIFLILLYWRGWLAVKCPQLQIKIKQEAARKGIIGLILAVGIVLSFWQDQKSTISHICSLEIYRELLSGEIAEYSQWSVSVIQAMERESRSQDNKECIEVHVPFIEDTTCLINPKYYYGLYNPEDTNGNNNTLARFYGVDLLYIYEEED